MKKEKKNKKNSSNKKNNLNNLNLKMMMNLQKPRNIDRKKSINILINYK